VIMKILKQKKKIVRRKSPLPGMSKEARPIWTETFKLYPPRHFKPSQYDLLRMFCEDCAHRNKALQQLSEMGPVLENKVTGDFQKNPLFAIVQKYEKSIRETHYLMDLKPELLNQFLEPELKIVGKNKK